MNFEKRILPLAGVLQCVHLVVSAAKTGLVSQDSLEKSLQPVFVQSPDSISDVYAGTKNITLGLSLCREVLTDFRPEDHADLVKYSLAVMGLEQVLSKDAEKMSSLGNEIERLHNQFSDPQQDVLVINDELIKALAEVYERVIGTITPRIKISGNRNHLQNIANIQRIRALLLAAVRSAVLWQQVGGRRWQLLIQRGAYRKALDSF